VTHERAQPLLLDLVYGELTPEEAQEVERHAGECAACATELAGLRETRRLSARLADEPAPGRGRDEILAAARRAVAAPPARPWTRARIYAVAASVGVVAVVAGVTLRLVGDGGPGRPQSPGAELPMPGAISREAGSREPERTVASAPAPAREGPVMAVPPVAAAPSPAPPAKATVREKSAEAPSSLEAAAPSRQREALAPQGPAAAARSAAADAVAGPGDGPDPVVAGVERRIAAGEMEERASRLSCDGVTVERTAWLDGERVAKLAVREGGKVLGEAWYDGAGKLRAVRTGGAGAVAIRSSPGLAGGAAATGLPDRAPSLSGLERCGW
jgi:hypothetical protein